MEFVLEGLGMRLWMLQCVSCMYQYERKSNQGNIVSMVQPYTVLHTLTLLLRAVNDVFPYSACPSTYVVKTTCTEEHGELVAPSFSLKKSSPSNGMDHFCTFQSLTYPLLYSRWTISSLPWATTQNRLRLLSNICSWCVLCVPLLQLCLHDLNTRPQYVPVLKCIHVAWLPHLSTPLLVFSIACLRDTNCLNSCMYTCDSSICVVITVSVSKTSFPCQCIVKDKL